MPSKLETMTLRTVFLLFVVSLGMSHLGHSQTFYSDVVHLDSAYTSEILNENALRTIEDLIGVKKSKKKKGIDSRISEVENGYETPFGFFVYKLKHPVFKINYKLTIEVKEGRYRYTIDNFYAQKYVRNRYGRYEPARNGELSISEEFYPSDQNTWDKARSMVKDHVDSVVGLIEMNMSELPVQEEQILSLKSDDW